MNANRNRRIGKLMAALLSLCGCGENPTEPLAMQVEPSVVKETTIAGFDVDGEPIIQEWSDGSLGIHFEAMPPFFSEEKGTEPEFENFELELQKALGVPVTREDRELFTIKNPKADTSQKAQSWLEGFHDQE